MTGAEAVDWRKNGGAYLRPVVVGGAVSLSLSSADFFKHLRVLFAHSRTLSSAAPHLSPFLCSATAVSTDTNNSALWIVTGAFALARCGADDLLTNCPSRCLQWSRITGSFDNKSLSIPSYLHSAVQSTAVVVRNQIGGDEK